MPVLKDLISGGLSGIAEAAGSIISKFKADPTKVIEAEAEIQKLKIQAAQESERLAVQLEDVYAKELETVNATMRDEAKSEHFMQWAWRPFIGFTFSAILINNYILLPYFHKWGMEVIQVPGDVWSAILVILGVASAGRSVKGTKWGK